MAAAVNLKQPRPSRTRHRSSSDPFSDPYPRATAPLRAPDPPPKLPPKMSVAATKPRDNHIVEAVRDTVTVSRKTPTRTQTALQSSVPHPFFLYIPSDCPC